MHELAIAESVVSSVLERTGDSRVSVVRLRVGRLSGVVPDALTFCFELAAAGTTLEGATLEIAASAAGRTAARAAPTSTWTTRSCCVSVGAPTCHFCPDDSSR